MLPSRGVLRVFDEEAPADVSDVEEDVRSGVLGPDAELRYAPWTGESFRPLGSIDQLREAFDAPDARLVGHLLRGPRPWASTAVTIGVGVLGLIVLMSPDTWSPASLGVGLDEFVFDGRWWTPWTAQVTHGGSSHLMGNLAVIGYSGYRVDKAMGRGAFAIVIAATLLCGTLAVLALSPAPVIGGSMLAYGLLGAHIAVGFRFGDAIPRRLKVRYGFGVLPFFAIPFAGALGGAGISHSAHLGGVIGGGLAALMLRPESIAAARDVLAGRRRNLALALGASVFTACLSPLGAALPGLAVGPSTLVDWEETGVLVPVPLRLRAFPVYTHGAPGWRTSRTSDDTLFGALQVRTDEGPDADEEARLWSAPEGWEAVEVPPVGPGWRAVAIEFQDGDGRRRAVEHVTVRGHNILRLGYSVALNETGEPNPRVELFERMIREAQVGEPPELVEARAEHLDRPEGRRRAARYGEALHDVGRHVEAEAVLGPLYTPGRLVGGRALELRVLLWSHHPEAFRDRDDAWIDEVLALAPTSTWYQGRGIPLLVDLGRCERAAAALASYEGTHDGDLGLPLLGERVAACEAN
jgi:membrane associated rhomboid family serine protease